MRRRGDEGRIVTVDDRDEDAAKRGAGNTFADNGLHASALTVSQRLWCDRSKCSDIDRIGVEKSRLAQRETM